MSDRFDYIIPALPPTADFFAPYQLAWEFRRETQTREDLNAYCQWYYETAERHRQEVKSMRNDVNILGWFWRLKR
jgi:hypothetical protein